MSRLRILITGQVQGVGFRPHVYQIATQLGLTGWVQNNAAGVLIEIQGATISQFLPHLLNTLPPLARVDAIKEKVISPEINENKFQIIASTAGEVRTIISPDTCICDYCLEELFNSKSRYYRYPFLNCTYCGPRLTITNSLPYDRKQTSMAEFSLCAACEIEYSDPNNRRYHAQPTACINCGPKLSLSIEQIVEHIQNGKIIALKGMGGYQLICDAYNETAVMNLRARKQRDAKPFALMAANVETANSIVEIDAIAKDLLMSKERPIVLLRKKDSSLPAVIAPGLVHYGVMLPYTPLHYLLFNALLVDELRTKVLVVTSANRGGQPLVIDDETAKSELANIADVIVGYNRKIVTRVDDSVVQVINNKPSFVRRARGYVPTSIKLSHAIPCTLAVGGHLKNTFCVTRDDEAFVSQHIGSLNNKASIDFFHESLDHLLKFLAVKPERIAHDLHPDFYTTQFAQNYGIHDFAIQHHHAHLAAVMAEHHLNEPVLGIVLDGYGYGTAGEAWGGELLQLEENSFHKLGSLYPLPQPGGEVAAREPWRMAAAVLHCLGRKAEISKRFANQSQAALMLHILDKKINTSSTSSCGRLFDAASALLGVNYISQYEGQGAMQLESLVTQLEVLSNGWDITNNNLNLLPTLEYLTEADPVSGANVFHGTLIAALAAWIWRAAQNTSVNTIVLSGGCFLNKILTEGLLHALTDQGLKPFIARQLPPNDGGISLGQAWIAGRMTCV